jgi:hypothetical protein
VINRKEKRRQHEKRNDIDEFDVDFTTTTIEALEE